MLILELVCLCLIGMYVFATLRRSEDRGGFLWRMFLLAGAAWLAEDSCIRLYGFYAYSPEWSIFVDRVPLMVLLIWPMVIHSSWRLARHLLAEKRVGVPLVGAALVLADASLIEPISVKAGLWWWTHPGLFGVPPIGILGWAYFAGFAMLVFERSRSRLAQAAVLAIAPLGAHALLLISWWALFRWTEGTIPPWPAVAVVWCVATLLTIWCIRARADRRMPLGELLLRIPAALFFFVLLGLRGSDVAALIAYAVAFAPPYCALTPWWKIVAGRATARAPSP